MNCRFVRQFQTSSFVALFIAVAASLVALGALAQQTDATRPSENPSALFVSQDAGAPLRPPQRLAATGTAASLGTPTSRSHRKKIESGAADLGSVSFRPVVTYDSAGAAGGGLTGSLAVADVNGDGKPDLIVANPSYGVGSIGVLLGNGDGTFQPVALNTSVGQVGEFNALAVADVNGDGKLDLVVVVCCASNGDFEAAVLLGNGDGTFQSAVTYDGGGLQESSLVVGDVNGDGRPDIV